MEWRREIRSSEGENNPADTEKKVENGGGKSGLFIPEACVLLLGSFRQSCTQNTIKIFPFLVDARFSLFFTTLLRIISGGSISLLANKTTD